MKFILAVLFVAFAASAAMTIFFQIKYGHLTGPDSDSAKLGTDSPAASKCRRQAVISAIIAAIFLIAACAVGVTLR